MTVEQSEDMNKLWADYLFLTQEILKFIRKKNLDMVLELVEQREKLQAKISSVQDTSYALTGEGKQRFQDILQNNKAIEEQMKLWKNVTVRQNQVSNAYDGVFAPGVGYRMDRQS